jgi:hypothetical protein
MPVLLEKKGVRCFIAGEWEPFARAVLSDATDGNKLALELYDHGCVVGLPGM